MKLLIQISPSNTPQHTPEFVNKFCIMNDKIGTLHSRIKFTTTSDFLSHNHVYLIRFVQFIKYILHWLLLSNEEAENVAVVVCLNRNYPNKTAFCDMLTSY